MRIGRTNLGTSQLGFSQTSTGERRDEMNPRVDPAAFDTSAGMQEFAASVKGAAEQLKAFEDERAGFAAMTQFSEATGQVEIGMRDLADNAAPDGAGFSGGTAKMLEERRAEFMKTVPPALRDQYTARWAEYSRDVMLRSDDFSRKAATGNALSVLGARIDAGQKAIYDNPGAMPGQAAELSEFLATAPIPPAEKDKLQKQAMQKFSLANIEGQLRASGGALFVPAGSAGVKPLMQAVVTVESSNRSGLVSPAGAVGLAQVLENDDLFRTGSEIAQELGDENFPFDGTQEERQEYLKDDEISVQYGTYYLNKQLTKYGGDVVLALIAYNAGAGRADEFRANGRDFSKLPTETQGYVPKVLKALTGGDIAIPEAMNTLAEHLTFDQLVVADNLKDAAVNRAEVASGKALALKADTDVAAMSTPYEKIRKQVFKGFLTQEGAMAAVDEMLADPSLTFTPEQAADLRGKMTKGVQTADLARFKMRELLKDPEMRELVQAFLFSDTTGELTLETLTGALEAEGRTQVEQRRAAVAEQRVARNVAYEQAGLNLASGADEYSGENGLAYIKQLHADGTVDPEKRRTQHNELMGIWRKTNEDMLKRGEIVGKIAAGHSFGPADADDFSLLVTTTEIDLLNTAKSPEGQPSREIWFSGTILPLVAETGVTPGNVMATLKKQAASPQWEDNKFALRAMAQLQMSRPEDFRTQFGSDTADRVTAFVTLMDTLGEGKTATYFASLRDPQQASARAALQATSKKELSELDLNDLRSSFDGMWPGVGLGNAASFAGQAGATMLLADYHNLYNAIRPLYPDASGAHSAALKSLQGTWGLDTNNNLMQYPPSKQYPAQDGDHLWVLDQFRRENNLPLDGSSQIVMQPVVNGKDIARKGGQMEYLVTAVNPDGTGLVVNNWYPDPEEAFEYRNVSLAAMGLPVTAETAAHRRFQSLLRDYDGLKTKKLSNAMRISAQSDMMREMDTILAEATEEETTVLRSIFEPSVNWMPIVAVGKGAIKALDYMGSLGMQRYTPSAQLREIIRGSQQPGVMDDWTKTLPMVP
jgi:hypothetical protein